MVVDQEYEGVVPSPTEQLKLFVGVQRLLMGRNDQVLSIWLKIQSSENG